MAAKMPITRSAQWRCRSFRRLARRRFGVVAGLERRIDAADELEIESMLDRLLTAAGPGDL